MPRCRARSACRRASQKSLFFFVRRWTSAQRPRRAPPRGLAPPAPRASPRPAPARRDGVSPRRAVCRRGLARRGGARGRAGVRVPRVVRVSAGRDRPDARGGDSPDRRPRRRGVARGRRGGPGRQGLGGDAERRPGVAPKPSRVVGGGDFGKFGFEARVPRDTTRFSSVQSSSVRHTLGDVSTDDFSDVDKDASTDTPRYARYARYAGWRLV